MQLGLLLLTYFGAYQSAIALHFEFRVLTDCLFRSHLTVVISDVVARKMSFVFQC